WICFETSGLNSLLQDERPGGILRTLPRLSLTTDIHRKWVRTGCAIDRTAGRGSEIGRLSRATPRSGVAAFGGRGILDSRPISELQSRRAINGAVRSS